MRSSRVFACSHRSHRSHCPCALRLVPCVSLPAPPSGDAGAPLTHRASHRSLVAALPLEQRACEARECSLARIVRIARIALAPRALRLALPCAFRLAHYAYSPSRPVLPSPPSSQYRRVERERREAGNSLTHHCFPASRLLSLSSFEGWGLAQPFVVA